MAEFILDEIEEKHDTFWVDVVLHRPVGTRTETHRLALECEGCDIDELRELGESDDDDRAFLLGKVRNWKGPVAIGENGKASGVTYSAARFATLLNRFWVLGPVRDAYLARNAGDPRGRQRKNS